MLFATPVGQLTLGYIGNNLRCQFGKTKTNKEPSKTLANQLKNYLTGIQIDYFDVETPEGPPFAMKCWNVCREIPYGETMSYKDLAVRAGSPLASRAAGQAMRNNPMTILTPCHRVVSSRGKLHGYSGTTNPQSIQLKRKMYLLNLEQL